MADEVTEKQVYDAHTKEIDLVNRDPKHLNDDVVKAQSWEPLKDEVSSHLPLKSRGPPSH
ncbi:caveolin-1 isoform 6 [Mus musculus]|nr:caveolin-1 isoform 6 [Mus musculus]NP_001396498.1 caveolin-1 isoform 6 [Mus musculus]